MNELLIEKLKNNIAVLISRYEILQAGNAEMAAKLAEYESVMNKQNEQIKNLEERLDNLQLTLAFDGSSPDRAEAKHKVAHLMKEIDKCISLLND